MTGKFVDIFLCVVLHALSFGDHIPYVFMILLKLPLLIRCIRITVENIAAVSAIFVFFDIPRVLEFRPIIGEYHLKIFSE